MTGSRFGEPIEVPWWVPLLALPPVAVIVGAALGPGPALGRLTGAAASLLMVLVLFRVATRVESRNMQSVWVSAAYAVWFFAALIWLVSATHP